ncbi:MAG: YkvA family protein [Lachnospiraceae bacterium]|nr:YkvA family protein [Lachnospiraceae bacterium]
MTLKERAKKMKSDIPVVFIALKDPDTPTIAKILAGITVGYALSPIDLIPDFVPVLGYLDDIIILPVLVWVTVKFIPEEVWQSSKDKAADVWRAGKPKKWYYAIPIVAIWALLIWFAVKAIWL